MLAQTIDRVARNTGAAINLRFDAQIAESIERYADATPEAIERRLAELDREWDIERVIEVEAPAMIPATATRVEEHTSPPRFNQQIADDLRERLDAYRGNDRRALIDSRLRELDREWDVERVLQTNFAALSLVGLGLASRVDKRWLILALGVPAFMLQHAVQGWCLPLAVLRRLGLRTAREISDERFALQSLRDGRGGVDSDTHRP